MATSRDVARAAGVSQATVSRVLTATGANVSSATRERVLKAMEEVGYVPNVSAQAMKTGRTRTVGVVVADLTNPFYPHILNELSSAFEDQRYRMTVWITGPERNDGALQAIRQGSVDGVVFTTVTEDSAELRGALENRSPVVLVNRTLSDIECDQVSSDNVLGGALVADYFVDGGRRHPAYIGGTPLATTSSTRLAGFTARLRARGCPLNPVAIAGGEYSHASGYAAMLRLLDDDVPVDAVFCSNDLLAFGALDAARSRNVRVPDDLWIVGYDDVDMASWESFDLTTVRQDIRGLARTAAQLLVERMTMPHHDVQRISYAPQLIIRNSTARLSS